MNRKHTVTFTFAEVVESLHATHRGDFSTAPMLGKPTIAVIDGDQIEITYISQTRPME